MLLPSAVASRLDHQLCVSAVLQHLAASNGHADAVRALLAANPKPALESKQEDGLTPLHCACCIGNTEVVKELLESGASVLSVSNDGWTPLHYVAGNGSTGALKVGPGPVLLFWVHSNCTAAVR